MIRVLYQPGYFRKMKPCKTYDFTGFFKLFYLCYLLTFSIKSFFISLFSSLDGINDPFKMKINGIFDDLTSNQMLKTLQCRFKRQTYRYIYFCHL